MATSIVQVRMDSALKNDVDKMLKSMGMNMSTAFNMLARQILIQKKLPFEVIAEDTAQQETDYILANCEGIVDDLQEARNPNSKEFIPASEVEW